jgi:hypothetical protein
LARLVVFYDTICLASARFKSPKADSFVIREAIFTAMAGREKQLNKLSGYKGQLTSQPTRNNDDF